MLRVRGPHGDRGRGQTLRIFGNSFFCDLAMRHDLTVNNGIEQYGGLLGAVLQALTVLKYFENVSS